MHTMFLLTSSAPDAQQRITEFCTKQMLNLSNWLSDDDCPAQAVLASGTEMSDISHLRDSASSDAIDINLFTAENRLKRLLLADMDATVIRGESLDELAALCGKGAEIAAITAKTMAGDIDFATGLDMRLSQLAGQPETLLQTVIDHTRFTSGAETLIATMRAHGAKCYLVSGGFNFLTSFVATRIGFHDHFANRLGISNGVLTGKAVPPLLDKDSKKQILLEQAETLGISVAEAICVGDGANDGEMLSAAGLGVAFEGKPALKQKIITQLDHTDLTGLLYLQGLTSDKFVHGIKNQPA